MDIIPFNEHSIRYRSNQDVERETGFHVNNRGFNGSTYHAGFLGPQVGEQLPGSRPTQQERDHNCIAPNAHATMFRANNGQLAISLGGFTYATLQWMLLNR